MWKKRGYLKAQENYERPHILSGYQKETREFLKVNIEDKIQGKLKDGERKVWLFSEPLYEVCSIFQ